MPKTSFGSETLFGVIIVAVGREFCQDDCGESAATVTSPMLPLVVFFH